MDYTEYARLFKALSDPKRLKIVHMLAGGELCACKILEEFHITQPTLSHDMKLLTAAGLVIPRREGKWTHYRLSETGGQAAAALLLQLTTPYATQERCSEAEGQSGAAHRQPKGA